MEIWQIIACLTAALGAVGTAAVYVVGSMKGRVSWETYHEDRERYHAEMKELNAGIRVLLERTKGMNGK